MRAQQLLTRPVRLASAVALATMSLAVAADTASAAVPSAPLSLSATPSNAQVVFSWTAPADNGGSDVTSYTVDDGLGDTCTTPDGTTTTCTVGSLTNGTLYTFTVAATNADGTSDVSNSVTATPFTVSQAPTDLTATPGDGAIALSWSAPSDNGGAAIQSYAVTDGAGHSCTTPDGTTTTCTVGSLTNGTAYTFTVTATNAAGVSSPSSSTTAIPVAVPGSPTNLQLTRAVGAITASWTAPAVSGGSDVTGYTVTATPRGAGDALTCTADTTAPLQCELTSVNDYATYDVNVVATNAVGDSLPSTSVASAGYADPAAPSNVHVIAGNGQLTITFTPGANGGLPVTGYLYSVDGGTTSDDLVGTAGAYVLTGLTNGTAYHLSLAEVTALNTSPFSSPVTATPATVPSAPRWLHGTRGNGSATLAWNAPASTGGAAILSYAVSDGAGHGCTATAPTSSCVVKGLTNGTLYTFTVVAHNVMGNSVASNTDKVQPATLPTAPSLSHVVVGNRSVMATITAPVSDGGASIIRYDYSLDGGSTWSDGTYVVVNGVVRVGTLTNGTTYHLVVRARNVVGAGPLSNIVSVTPFAAPAAPSIRSVTATKSTVTIRLALPATNGAALTHLEYSLNGGASWTTTSVSTTLTINLALGRGVYVVVLRADNAAGIGATSAPWRLVLT